MSLTYDVIDVSLGRTMNDMVSKFFIAKRERLILLPVKFQLHIISRSTIFNVSKGARYTSPPQISSPLLKG